MVKKIFIIWGIVNLIGVAILFSGCCTHNNQPVIIDTGGIATVEAGVDDLERRLREYGAIITAYDGVAVDTIAKINAIRGRADQITDRIDRVIFLFEEYDREVSKLLDAYNRIRSQYQISE